MIVAVSHHKSKNDFKNLGNTIFDANKLKATLRKLGWKVEMALDLGLGETVRKMREFAASSAQGDGDCLFAFAGHGIELNGRNYLVAADSKFETEYTSEKKFEQAAKLACLPFEDVQSEFKDARGSSAGVCAGLLPQWVVDKYCQRPECEVAVQVEGGR